MLCGVFSSQLSTVQAFVLQHVQDMILSMTILHTACLYSARSLELRNTIDSHYLHVSLAFMMSSTCICCHVCNELIALCLFSVYPVFVQAPPQ